jgi:myo-inositol 2-dehydrogenase / D-chiro-inositol 1-dehydrogenase
MTAAWFSRTNAVRRGAIIGFGAVAANGHWPAYAKSSETQIVAVVDRTEQRRQAAREAIPGVETFANMDELGDGVGIDFVDICTPPAFHGEPMREALRRGWDVLCEKPLLLDARELEEARSLARQAGRAVIPVHNWKYAPIIRRASEVLGSGAIGELRELQIETLRIEDCAAIDPEHPNWRRDPSIAGGGILMDHGWHAIYLARHWFGEDVAGSEAKLHRAEIGIEDEATLTLKFPKGRARIFLTWRANQRRNTMRLIGERGEIAIDDDTLKIGDDNVRFENALSSGSHHADWFAAMLPDVMAAFRSPEKSRASLDEAALCLSVIRSAYEIA